MSAALLARNSFLRQSSPSSGHENRGVLQGATVRLAGRSVVRQPAILRHDRILVPRCLAPLPFLSPLPLYPFLRLSVPRARSSLEPVCSFPLTIKLSSTLYSAFSVPHETTLLHTRVTRGSLQKLTISRSCVRFELRGSTLVLVTSGALESARWMNWLVL